MPSKPLKNDTDADDVLIRTAASMTEESPGDGFPLDALRRYVPLAAWTVVILVILAIPFKIVSYGYLPGDDALRHAAKAVSGKSWSEILILNPTYKMDHEFGWNLLLEKIHLWNHAGAESLVLFSVVSLFLVVGWSVLPWLKRPEAWLMALIVLSLLTGLPQRILLGRPYLMTMAALLNVLFLWQTHGSSAPKWWMMGLMTALTAASTFMHGVWYLWALPVWAFFLAAQFRWGITLMVCSAAGIFLGSALTGHPVGYPLQAIKLALLATGMQDITHIKALELQPFNGNVLALLAVGGLLVLRRMARLETTPLHANPVFWLAVLCWVLGFLVGRFWFDWGLPALLVLLTSDLQLFLQPRFVVDSFRRLALVCGAALTLYAVSTNDIESRWTENLAWQFLAPDNQDLTGWLPDRGGIFYTADMTLFYQTFFKNPNGDWRYMLGFEPTWMPAEDFKVYHLVHWNFGDSKAYEPWVEKMQPADRLVIRGGRGNAPDFPQLEWEYGVSDIWIGRLPRTNAPPPAPTIPARVSRNVPANPVGLPR